MAAGPRVVVHWSDLGLLEAVRLSGSGGDPSPPRPAAASELELAHRLLVDGGEFGIGRPLGQQGGGCAERDPEWLPADAPAVSEQEKLSPR
jgi:hypothetical protein